MHMTPDLTPDQICITFNSIGRDFGDCDVDFDEPGGPVEGARHHSVLRFFTELDRLPGLHDNREGLSPAPENYFPDGTDTHVDNDADLDPAFWAPNRSYRHPFLVNAGDPGVALDGTGTQAISPMLQWMLEFVTEYRHLQTTGVTIEDLFGQTATYSLPSPTRFYLDTEPQITSQYGGRNQS
jgi:hypothetical protein